MATQGCLNQGEPFVTLPKLSIAAKLYAIFAALAM
jgi:hypothetical protein